MSPEKNYKGITPDEMREFLEEKYLQYNTPEFIENDPVSIPHMFSDNHDREISGFLTATIAWGRRDLILRSAHRLMELMGNSPYEFILNASGNDLKRFSQFVHRTFNGDDCMCFLRSLMHIYRKYSSMEDIISRGIKQNGSIVDALALLRKEFFSVPHICHAKKHFADVAGGAAGKRLFMFLRWMVRNDGRGVDFGIWKKIKPSQLYIPLDFHTGNTARKLGLIKRKQNDFKAVEELTAVLRKFDPEDPVKYDFALFGLGIYERF